MAYLLEIEVSLVRDSPVALNCVLEQDTLSSAYYCFNQERQEINPP